jgi:hypothetical protein
MKPWQTQLEAQFQHAADITGENTDLSCLGGKELVAYSKEAGSVQRVNASTWTLTRLG